MSDRTGEGAVRRMGVAAMLLAAIAAAGPVAGQSEPAAAPAGETIGLAEAVERALGRSREVQQARLALEEAEGRVTEAWGAVYPSVDLTADWTRNVSPAVSFLPAIIFDPGAGPDDLIPVQFGADNSWAMNLNVDQALFRFGVFVGVGAAARYQELQEEVLRGSTQGVVTSVRQAYYAVLLGQEQERLTENSVRRVRRSLEETHALNRAGLASDYDVLRLEVELANLEPNLRRARNQVAASRRELAVVLDLEDPEALRVSGSLATMELTDLEANDPANRRILDFAAVEPGVSPDPERLVARAQESRSDLRQLVLTEALRRAEMRVEQGQYLPEISLFGNYSIDAQQNGSPEFFGEPRAYGRRVGIRVTLPIFNGLQREARIDQRQAALRSAETQTRLARDRAANQVRTFVDQAEEARLRAEAQRLAVTQARRGFEIARAEYREGLGSRLQLTDAEVALRQTEFNYAQAVYDYLVARARLDEAIGHVPGVDRR